MLTVEGIPDRAAVMAADFHALIDLLPDLVLLVGEDGAVLDANRLAMRTLDGGGTLVGRRISDLLIGPTDKAVAYLRRCSGSREPLIGVLVLRGADGRPLDLRCSGAAMRGALRAVMLHCRPRAEAVDRFSILGRRLDELSQEIRLRRKAERELRRLNDTLEQRVAERTGQLAEVNRQLTNEMAERRQAEEALRHAQKMEAVGQLTGGIAHDFNNLLTVIIGALFMVEERSRDGDILKVARSAMRAAERGSRLTQQLLAFSRKQLLHLEVLDLNRLVETVGELLSRTLGSGVVVEIRLGAELWSCVTDPSQIETALLNLALNARDAMPQGGRLTVETANVALCSAEDASFESLPGEYVMVAVSDTGTGIPPEILDRVFEPFFTTKEVGKGTGLGLSQVYGFVKQSGGHVAIDSTVGRGTTLRLYLPRSTATLPTAAPAALRPGPPRRGSTVLVVEDDPDVRELAVFILSNLGHKVLQAGDGPEALRIFDETPSIDLLFTDIVLTGGMNGFEVARAARTRRPEIKVLYTSGYTAKTLAGDQPIDARLIDKPFRAEELAIEVGALLEAE